MKKLFSRLHNLQKTASFMHASHLFAAEVAVAIMSLGQALVITRVLGPSQYGILALVIACVSIANQIVDFRVRETTITFTSGFLARQEMGKAWASIKLCYLIDIASGIAAFFIVCAAAPWAAAHLLHQPHAQGVIILYALTLLICTTDGASMGVLSVFRRFPVISAYNAGFEALKLVMVCACVVSFRSVESVLWAYIISCIAANTVLLFLCMKTVREHFHRIPDTGIRSLKEQRNVLAAFLLNTNANEILTLVTRNLDVLILGYFRMPKEVGVYRIAKSFVGVLAMIGNPVYTVIYPQIVSLWNTIRMQELGSYLKRITLAMTLISVPLAGALALCIGMLLNLTVGNQFLDAKDAVRVMLWGPLVANIFVWVRPVYLAMKKPGTLTMINFFSAVILIVLSLWLVPKGGVAATALLSLIPYIAGHALALAVLVRLWKTKTQPA